MSFEKGLGHTFDEPSLLRLALTHRSVSAEDHARNDNERLEFLGDAVLQLVVTDELYSRYPHLAEGQMAKVRAAVVSRPTLAEIARKISLGDHIELAAGEDRTGGRSKDSILADAMEAVLGAVYLDGGLESARSLILEMWGPTSRSGRNGRGSRTTRPVSRRRSLAPGDAPSMRFRARGPIMTEDSPPR
jgi:ribonuclease-3